MYAPRFVEYAIVTNRATATPAKGLGRRALRPEKEKHHPAPESPEQLAQLLRAIDDLACGGVGRGGARRRTPVDVQLTHNVRDPLGRSYNRTALLGQLREMLQRWADYLDTLRKDVVSLAEAAA